KTCKCFGHVVPRHSKKNHFASRCLFLGGSHCSRTKLIDNFSEAVGTSAIAKLYLMACLQCPLCERLREISCSNGSDFHTVSFLTGLFSKTTPVLRVFMSFSFYLARLTLWESGNRSRRARARCN